MTAPSWHNDPWPDSAEATLGGAWLEFRAAFTCALLGHRWTVVAAGDPPWRICTRCGRKEEWRV